MVERRHDRQAALCRPAQARAATADQAVRRFARRRPTQPAGAPGRPVATRFPPQAANAADDRPAGARRRVSVLYRAGGCGLESPRCQGGQAMNHLSTSATVMMLVVWAVILLNTGYCFYRLLTS